jgi:hypothetical protein
LGVSVARRAAHGAAVQFEGTLGLLGSDEFGYIAVFVWLILAGPGRASLDALLLRLFAVDARSRVGLTGRASGIRSSWLPFMAQVDL